MYTFRIFYYDLCYQCFVRVCLFKTELLQQQYDLKYLSLRQTDSAIVISGCACVYFASSVFGRSTE